MKASDIDLGPLRTELQEQGGNETITVKLDKNAGARVCASYTDDAIRITLNNKKIRTEAQLKRAFDACRELVAE